MPNNYGSACWELAQEVLTDHIITTEQIDALSEAIQKAIEEWLDSNSEELERMTDE